MKTSRGSANDCLIAWGTSLAIDPLDSTTYYAGLFPVATPQGLGKIRMPRGGTISKAYLNATILGTLGSSETFTISIRLNNSTDTTITATATLDSVYQEFSNLALGLVVAEGDYIEVKIVTPAWATNPTTVYMNGIIYLQ